MADQFSKHRFESLECLRGYMAWWVVATHALGFTGLEPQLPRFAGFLMRGDRAVHVFIILSGFVITHLSLSRRESYPQYLVRRAFRLLPIYYVMLAVGILLTEPQLALHGAPWAKQAEVWVPGFQAQEDHFWTHLLLHASLLHGAVPDSWLPYASWTFIGPAWSLSLEWQFYLVAPFIVWLLRQSTALRILTCACFLAACVGAQHLSVSWRFQSMLLLAMPWFLVGMLTRLYLPQLCKLNPWCLLLAGGAVAVLLGAAHGVEAWIWTFFVVALTFEGAVTKTLLQSSVEFVAGNRVFKALGKASYSSYLVHTPLMALSVWIGHKIVGEASQALTILCASVAVVLVIPVSQLLYRHIELPFSRRGAKLAESMRLRSRIAVS